MAVGFLLGFEIWTSSGPDSKQRLVKTVKICGFLLPTLGWAARLLHGGQGLKDLSALAFTAFVSVYKPKILESRGHPYVDIYMDVRTHTAIS